jgi:hypothetical protein
MFSKPTNVQKSHADIRDVFKVIYDLLFFCFFFSGPCKILFES